jgi:hypothetical protein
MIEGIEKAVERLSPEELARFRTRFEEFDARLFDEKIERDAKSGKVDKQFAEARANHAAGRRETVLSRSGLGAGPARVPRPTRAAQAGPEDWGKSERILSHLPLGSFSDARRTGQRAVRW